MKKKSWLAVLICGLVSIIVSFVFLMTLSIPTIKEETFSFSSSFKDKEVTLNASYWENKNSDYAVLICPGYSCDRQKWRPYADLCVKNGLTTMTFDYSGQGDSSGVIGFDNAKTDVIPIQIDDAIKALHDKSGYDYEKIILVGHSMGGRSILRLLYNYNEDSTPEYQIPERFKTDAKPIKNVIVISPEVNYSFNAQASLFAGTSDANEMPWKEYREESIGSTNLYVFGSTGDDIVKPSDCFEIFKRIGGQTGGQEDGTIETSNINSKGSRVTLKVLPGVLHSYLMYDTTIARYSNDAFKEITGITPSFVPGTMSFVYIGWGTALVGVFLVLFAFNNMPKKVELENEVSRNIVEGVPTLIDSKKYLLRKLLMWLPGILMAVLICCVAAVMPFGSPIMNIPYMCFVAGYGVVMAISYRKGNFKGTENKLPKISFKVQLQDKKKLFIGLGVSALMILFVWYVLRTSMYRLLPGNWRLFWLFFAGALMGVGYYVSSSEVDMLNNAGVSWKIKFLYNLIQYVPLFLFVLFYLIIGSYSGLIGQAQNMVLMYTFCIPVGDLIKKSTGNRLYGAIATALLFQGIMVTSAALISFF